MNQNPANDARIQRMTDIAGEIVTSISSELKNGIPADKSLTRIFREHREYGSRDRRLYSTTTYSYFRWFGWTQLITDDVKQRCGLSVMLDESVNDTIRDIWKTVCAFPDELVSQLGSNNISDKCKHLAVWAKNDTLSLAHLVPAWLPEVISSPDTLVPFIQSCQSRPPTWVHVSKSRCAAFAKFMDAQKVPYRRHTVLTGAFAIEPPFQLEQLESGWGNPIQVQDLASQAVIAACDAKPGDTWWDTCCGSGGKTLGLAEACGANGNIVATDVRVSILRNLKKRAKAHRFKQIHMRMADVTTDSLGPARFNGVLVDAPCSGIGTWPRNPGARWRTDPDTISRIAQTQTDLLEKASAHVHPGGRLVYSVCTITKSEGPDIISGFLANHPDFERIAVPHPLNEDETSGEIQIMPSEGPCDGMFIAVMGKRAE